MYPFAVITCKRDSQGIDKLGCFFCQSSAGDLRAASKEGIVRIRTVGDQRKKLVDVFERLGLLGGRIQCIITEMAQILLFYFHF